MILRTAVLAIYLAALAAALALQFVVPGIAVYVFYGFLFWLIASFFVFRMPAMSRPIARGSPVRDLAPNSSPGPADAPSLALPSSTPPIALPFCAYCGADLPEGATTCPACRHAVRSF
ncbi:MAG: hypothetical protein L3J93_00830 [Thermoplasmata archaeon]|nr:hypothetical protein [Thermoplasmata archaeon]